MKAIGYLRVSTQEQGKSNLGIEGQQVDIEKFCKDNNIELVDVVREIASAKGNYKKRPILNSTLSRCKKEKCALIVSKLDRFSRNVESVANMVNDKSIRFIVAQLGLDADDFKINLYATLAQQERDLIGERTKKALEAKKARGESLGSNVNLKDAQAKGAEQTKKDAQAFAETMRLQVQDARNSGRSWSAIAKDWTGKMKTARGGDTWTAQQVLNIAKRLGVD